MNEKKLTRDIIIKTLTEALETLNYVYAFYEGGAAAFSRIDKWSDIDLYLVVDNEKVDDAFLDVEKALKSLSPIKQKFKTPQLPWPGVSQAFYKLEKASEYLLIDLAVIKLSAPEKFLEPQTHGNAVFYINKSTKISQPRFDKEAFLNKFQGRLEILHTRFAMFNNLVQKEMNRGNHLEAIEWYHAFTLATLVEALRLKYNPIHHDFKLRYIHYELPPGIIKKLEQLYFINDEKDLQEKYRKASKWFRETMSNMSSKVIERLIK